MIVFESIRHLALPALWSRCLIVVIPGVIVIVLLTTPLSGFAEDEELSIEETVEELKLKVDRLTASEELARGRKIYQRACSPCHGIRGDGKGPAAQGFDPAPRNFRRGSYKFRTTVSGALPLDTDLQRTIREGVPGTEMPRWKSVLSDHDINAVVQYIKSFSPSFADPDSQPLPEDILEVPEERPFEKSLASIAAGRKFFIDQDCVKCHGENGKGDGAKADELVDDWDDPIRPANLTRPYFKNGKRDQDIYRVFTSGLNGTPMPAFDELSDDERWQLVDYVQSLEVKKGFWYWLFRENPNQVRHPPVEKSEITGSTGSDG
jgi:cytochrome c oxidase cbb3-type subunit 2